MKPTRNSIWIVAAVLWAVPIAFAQFAGNDDVLLQQTVQQQLAGNPAFAGVHAEAQAGKVTLNGSVATRKDREHAEDLVKSVPGVKGLKDRLRVTTAQTESPDRPVSPGAAAGTSPATSSGASSATTQAGDTGTTGANRSSDADSNSKSNQPASTQDDTTPHQIAWVQPPGGNLPAAQAPVPPDQSASPSSNRGESAYGNNAFARRGARLLYASCQDNSPTMSDSHSEGLKASSPAAAFSSAPPSAGLSDGPLQSQIENAIRRDPGLSGSRLSVHVAGNQVELSGTAPTGKEKETADRLARSFAVDRKVDNKVAVAGQGPGSTTLPEPASNAAAEKNPKPRRAANSTARAEQPQ